MLGLLVIVGICIVCYVIVKYISKRGVLTEERFELICVTIVTCRVISLKSVSLVSIR